MKVKIQDKEFDLVYSMRSHIIYENIAGETLDFENFTSMKTVSTFLLACIYAAAQKQEITLNLTYNEYMDWLDENGGYSLLNDFAVWLAEQISAQYNILPKTEEDNKKTKTLKTKKKV